MPKKSPTLIFSRRKKCYFLILFSKKAEEEYSKTKKSSWKIKMLVKMKTSTKRLENKVEVISSSRENTKKLKTGQRISTLQNTRKSV